MSGAGVLKDAGVEVRGLTKTFSGQQGPVRAVREVDISIARGETVALLGPNGAGKTTTIDMILGLLEPDAGSVAVLGRKPSAAVSEGLVGGMLQTGALLRDLSVRDLVSMTASLYPNPLDVSEVITLTGLDGIAGRRTQKLSGGETQRARFAIALVGNPDLLVLDEPTVALDVEGRIGFWNTMRALAGREEKRCCSQPTTSRRPTRTPTGSCSWRGAAWSPTGRRPR